MASPELSRQGRDPWVDYSRHTHARIALGRAGGSLRTSSLLDFRLSHARARDAVHAVFDANEIHRELAEAGIDAEILTTAATSRESYLLRPDLGRKLSEGSREFLLGKSGTWGTRDLVIIVSDGLSALAAHRQVMPLLKALIPALVGENWNLYPILIAPFGRVKLQDEMGSILGARQSLILLGERPGLGAPDSLGAYFTWAPSPEKTDADRNCISNIRPEGLAPFAAARKIATLLAVSAQRQLSGVALKDSTVFNLNQPNEPQEGHPRPAPT